MFLKTVLTFMLLPAIAMAEGEVGHSKTQINQKSGKLEAIKDFDGKFISEMAKDLNKVQEQRKALRQINYSGTEAEKKQGEAAFKQTLEAIDQRKKSLFKAIKEKHSIPDKVDRSVFTDFGGIVYTDEQLKEQEEVIKKFEEEYEAVNSDGNKTNEEKADARVLLETERAKLASMKESNKKNENPNIQFEANFEKLQTTTQDSNNELANDVNQAADEANEACNGVTNESPEEDRNKCQAARRKYQDLRSAYDSSNDAVEEVEGTKQAFGQTMPDDAAQAKGTRYVCNRNAFPVCEGGRDRSMDHDKKMETVKQYACAKHRPRIIRRLWSGCKASGYGNKNSFKDYRTGQNHHCSRNTVLMLTREFTMPSPYPGLIPGEIKCTFTE